MKKDILSALALTHNKSCRGRVMINQNEIEEAAKQEFKSDDYCRRGFVAGSVWAINLLKERSGKSFREWWTSQSKIEPLKHLNQCVKYEICWRACELAVEARHSEELKKLEDRLDKLREALDVGCDSLELRGLNAEHLRGALALDDQLKEGK